VGLAFSESFDYADHDDAVICSVQDDDVFGRSCGLVGGAGTGVHGIGVGNV
jgi:hypothetical protein